MGGDHYDLLDLGKGEVRLARFSWGQAPDLDRFTLEER